MENEGSYRLRLPESVVTLIRGLHPEIKIQIRAGLKMVLESPYSGKPLKDELEGLRSLRVKRFRIIYQLDTANKEILILVIGPRKTIYEETYRLISRDG